MSESNIALLTDVSMLTCIVDKGKGEDVVKISRGVGVGGALIHSSRGVGIRERVGLLGIAIEAEKDVVELFISSDQVEMITRNICSAMDIARPGGGFIYLTPLEGAATYLPQEIRERLKEQAK